MTNVTRLNAADNVVVAPGDITAGSVMDGEGVSTISDIARGHKIATVAIAKGDAVRKYDQIIGFTTTDIQVGDHVHSHNLEFGEFARDYASAKVRSKRTMYRMLSAPPSKGMCATTARLARAIMSVCWPA